MQERQRGLFDAENYEASQARFKNPSQELNKMIAWDDFLPILEQGLAKERKGFGGR